MENLVTQHKAADVIHKQRIVEITFKQPGDVFWYLVSKITHHVLHSLPPSVPDYSNNNTV